MPDAATLEAPFRLTPTESHPFLLLKDFFETVKSSLWREEGRVLARFLSGLWQQEVLPEQLQRILIRYEKYGTLYHVASLEILTAQKRIKLAVSAAFTPEAKDGLDFEFEILRRLNDYYQFPYLPQVVYKDPVKIEKNGQTETVLLMLAQWFEGYHEWHFAAPETGEQKIVIWDQEKGTIPASGEVCREIIRQAAYILTLYFDMEEGYQIHPWHHGAGDFIVKTGGQSTDVRLITVRGYEKLFRKKEETQPETLMILLSFFLDMTVKMRLDKAEGLGEPIWADGSVVAAIPDGFFRALKIKELMGDHPAGKTEEVVSFMKFPDKKKIEAWFYLQLERYRNSEKEDYPVIRKNIDDHAADVFRALQNFNPAFLAGMKMPQ